MKNNAPSLRRAARPMWATALVSLSMIAHTQHVAVAGSSFGADLEFLRQHTEVVVLSDSWGKAQVAVAPAWQGRVMTSSAGGVDGLSFGWVNRELISSRVIQPHINVFGGEDRFWLGPEGGQFSIFFAKGAAFDLAHWQTPASLDTEPFTVARKAANSVVCERRMQITNYSGTTFDLTVEREVKLVDAAQVLSPLKVKIPAGVKAVGFESVNTIKNVGAAAWKKDTGLLSIWILGMFNAAPSSTIVIPYAPGAESKLGPVVNDTYFGKVPAERLVNKKGVLYFSADANYRSKIGIPPNRAKSMLGSYDASSQVLTLVQYTLPKAPDGYVNSMWQIQDNPFGGDVVNSYNDGAPSPGAKQLGKFFELESSSPALALAPNQSATHSHLTLHLQGTEKQLDAISRAALGVGIEDIKGALKR